MDAYCKQYPINTAPAGYACPACSSPIFPASNLVSPVADVLRNALANRPWAREGLGLPLLPFENSMDSSPAEPHQIKAAPVKQLDSVDNFTVAVNVENDTSNTFHRNEPGIEPNTFLIIYQFFKTTSTILFLVGQVKRSNGLLTGSDRDEGLNKYKRRPPWQAFKRMLRYAFNYFLF